MIVELKVKKSGRGDSLRLTLTEKREGERQASDCKDELFGNADHAEFYRATAHYLHVLHREGHNVSYEDAQY